MTKDEAKRLLEAFVAHNEMEDTRRYVAEGRAFADFSDDILNSAWLGAWEDFFLYHSDIARNAYYDYSAELRLRGLALPEHRIAASKRAQVIERSYEVADRPDVKARLSADIQAFCKEWQKPKN